MRNKARFLRHTLCVCPVTDVRELCVFNPAPNTLGVECGQDGVSITINVPQTTSDLFRDCFEIATEHILQNCFETREIAVVTVVSSQNAVGRGTVSDGDGSTKLQW